MLTPSSAPSELERARALVASGRFAEALAPARRQLEASPTDRDALLVEAQSLRHLKQIDAALAALDRLEAAHPHFSRLHQERGLCRVALRDAPGAIDSLLRAVNINPALVAAWQMLAGLYRLVGDQDNAALADNHVAILTALPPDVVTATALYSDGDLEPAEVMVRHFLQTHGHNAEAMRLLAKIGIARDVLDDAELLLAGALELSPDYRAARFDYAHTLALRHKYVEAREQINLLLALDPDNYDYRALAATAAVGLGEHERVIELYHEMLRDRPDDADVYLWLGHALKTIGRMPEAVAAYHSAAATRPDFGDAYWSLANLKVYRFTDAEIAEMRRLEALETTRLADRYHLCFALGKGLEDRGDAAEAWSYYERGNAQKRSESAFSIAVFETNTRNQKQVCTRAFFAEREGWGDPRPDPIFIVGLPRSGSTLLEQILASHSQVDGTQELADIPRIVLDLQRGHPDPENPIYPGVLADMPREEFARLGAKYLADTRIYRHGAPRFVDKMPNNFRHIGLIHLMLPNARIIDARREPMACCFSNFKQLFANGQEFTYNLEDIARYYRTYLDLMQHWDTALPGRVLRVQHEDVVQDLEGSVRRLLDFCDLPFEESCVSFHKTARSVRTPSSEQVRRPIYRDGMEQWKPFEPWLGPLKAALGEALVG